MTPPRWAYADSSVLVKRYVREPASTDAGRLTSSHEIITSALASVEILSALLAKHRGGTLTARALAQALSAHAREKTHWTVVELTSLVLGRAEDVIHRVSARTADAIHIASALFFADASGTRFPFLTADERQRRSAEGVGLKVIWIGRDVHQP